MKADERPEPMQKARVTTASESAPGRLGELLNGWREGLGGVRRRKLLFLALLVFTPGWLISIYNWAALPLARPWQLAVVAITGMILVALPAAALWLIFRGASWAALLTVRGYTTTVLWALLGVWLPWQIVWWVIPLESESIEGALAAIRFVTADGLLSAGLLWLGEVLARLGARQPG